MANTTVTPAIIRSLRTQFMNLFATAFAAATVYYERLATIVPSTTASNTYGWMSKIPRIREWIGERVVNRLASTGYQITNKDFEVTIGVDRNDIEDDNMGMYAPTAQLIGEEARKHPDDLVLDLIRKGHQQVCHDGQFFF